ncbi:GNAT family N-acetyltransferase [Microvirga sp. W0021]|uniref:GNAT family N-acetyltransferase n=1 Tax=Hohaiivirga grylli TaxID=3133970 RepID=A0ABV0BIW1_9HYPH
MTLSSRFSKLLHRNTSQNIRIEEVHSEQAETIAEIHGASFVHGWSENEFERLLSDKNCFCDGLFLAKAKKPSGFILSRKILDEAEILTVAMSPGLRGQKLSSPLLKKHLETLAQIGVRIVHLEVDENNLAAIKLYEKKGFEVTGRRRGYYAQPDGSRTTALTMSLTL